MNNFINKYTNFKKELISKHILLLKNNNLYVKNTFIDIEPIIKINLRKIKSLNNLHDINNNTNNSLNDNNNSLNNDDNDNLNDDDNFSNIDDDNSLNNDNNLNNDDNLNDNNNSLNNDNNSLNNDDNDNFSNIDDDNSLNNDNNLNNDDNGLNDDNNDNDNNNYNSVNKDNTKNNLNTKKNKKNKKKINKNDKLLAQIMRDVDIDIIEKSVYNELKQYIDEFKLLNLNNIKSSYSNKRIIDRMVSCMNKYINNTTLQYLTIIRNNIYLDIINNFDKLKSNNSLIITINETLILRFKKVEKKITLKLPAIILLHKKNN